MKKMTHIAKTLDTFASIMMTVCLVVCIVLAVSVAALLLFDYEAYEFSRSLKLGSYSFGLASAAPDTVRQEFLWAAALGIVALVFVWLVVRIIRKILAPMKEGEPFDTAVSLNLRKLSWITLISGAVCSLVKLIGEAVMFQLYDFPSLFINGRIISCTMDYQLDGAFIAGFLILYLLSYVFRYGEELQQQTDETL